MFTIDGRAMGLGVQEFWSFDETAEEMGCAAGDLQRSIDAIRSRGPWITGFRALHLADCQKLLADAGRTAALTPRPGFGDLVDYSEAEKATGRNGVAFQDAIKRLHIADTKVECLTAEGHRTALDQFAGLKDEKPPAGLNGVQVADWREQRAAAKVLAREAATAARSGQPARPVGKRGKGRGVGRPARACVRSACRILGPS